MNMSRAFTLVELLVVVAIIGILAAIITPNVVTQIDRAKFAKTQALIQSLEVALETYKLDYKKYPPSMYDTNSRDAIAPSEFYKIIGERAKSPVSIKGKDLKEYQNGDFFWDTKTYNYLLQGGVPASVLTAPASTGTERAEAIVDAWGNPLYYVASDVYCPNRKCLNPQTKQPYMNMPIAYETEGGGAGSMGRAVKPKNPNTFQLISFGPDMETLPAGTGGGIGSNHWDDQRDNDGDDVVDRGDNAQTTENDTPPEDDVPNF
ncbi:MAG: prepilin-type N-terminal cleavage/methylation domain-containing protein [bacterium]